MFTKMRFLAILFVGALLVLGFQLVLAQTESTIEITGTVEAIGEGTITVDGLVIDIGNVVEFEGDGIQIGAIVEIEGTLSGGVVIAIEIEVELSGPESTPEVTPEVSPEVTPEITPEATADPDDDDDEFVIVIVGPVVEINVNVITIYNFEIELDPEDPALTVIQVGDIVRIEGDIQGEGDTIIIVAVNIIFINVEVVIYDGEVWRDTGNCSNPPPPWAPANGWRQRCQGGGVGGGGGSGSGSDS